MAPSTKTIRAFDFEKLAWFTERFYEQSDSRASSFGLAYFISMGVIEHFLGHDWIMRQVAPKEVGNKQGPCKYFTLDTSSREYIDLHRSRVISLGENLYNLQTVFGVVKPKEHVTFDEPHLRDWTWIVDRLKTDQRGIIGTCLELEAMHIMRISGIPFKLIHDGAGKGLRFDLRVMLPNARGLL